MGSGRAEGGEFLLPAVSSTLEVGSHPFAKSFLNSYTEFVPL